MKNVIKDDLEAQAKIGERECVAISFNVIKGELGVLAVVLHRGSFADCKRIAAGSEAPYEVAPQPFIEKSYCGVMPSDEWDAQFKGPMRDLHSSVKIMAPSDQSIIN